MLTHPGVTRAAGDVAEAVMTTAVHDATEMATFIAVAEIARAHARRAVTTAGMIAIEIAAIASFETAMMARATSKTLRLF